MARRIRGKEVLRLRSVNGLSQNAIARAAHVSECSFQDVLEAAKERVAARQTRYRVQVDAAGAEVRHRLDRPLRPVQEEGLGAEARRRVAYRRDHGKDRTTRFGSTWERPSCGIAADRPAAIKRHRGHRRPRCPSAISAVPFRDIRQCSGEQILNSRMKKRTTAFPCRPRRGSDCTEIS